MSQLINEADFDRLLQSTLKSDTRAYEYGVYTDQVLQCKFMPGITVLSNLSPQ